MRDKPLKERWQDKAFDSLHIVLAADMPSQPDWYVETNALLLVKHWLCVAEIVADCVDWRRHPQLGQFHEALDRALDSCRPLSKKNISEGNEAQARHAR